MGDVEEELSCEHGAPDILARQATLVDIETTLAPDEDAVAVAADRACELDEWRQP